MHSGLGLEVQRLPHLIEAWRDARFVQALVDEKEQFVLLGGEHREAIPLEQTGNV